MKKRSLNYDAEYMPRNTPVVPVDFERKIIQDASMTWNRWCSRGYQQFPKCRPVKVELIDRHEDNFSGFIDLRKRDGC